MRLAHALLLAVVLVSSPAEGQRLLDGDGGFLLATPTTGDNDNMLTVLRIVGNPNTTGRMLTINATANADGTAVDVRVFAVDGASPIIRTQILGNNIAIATCTTPPGQCNFLWPGAKMLAGNNELSMVYIRFDGRQFQTYGRIAKPVPR